MNPKNDIKNKNDLEIENKIGPFTFQMRKTKYKKKKTKNKTFPNLI